MSEERYDITCDDILARVEYPSGCAASFFADGSASDRFAFAAIRQQARDIAELRAQLAESSAATADQRASMTQHADELYAAVTDLCDERDKLRTDLAAAVAERDSIAIERDQARLTLREIAQILIDQIGSAGPENAINVALRACEVIESMATRLAAIDAAYTVADVIAGLDGCKCVQERAFGLFVPDIGTELIARPAKES